MKNTLYAVLSSVLFLLIMVPQVHASVTSSQLDSSGTPSHYWHSDSSAGAFLILDPNDGQPGYSIGNITTADTNVVGIHIKVQFNANGGFATLPRIPLLFDESGTHAFACAQMPIGGVAYPTAEDALALTNPIQFGDYNGNMIDMYFQCNLGAGHDQVFANTSYRLFLSPISSTDVTDIFVAMNAAGTEPYYELSDDGTFPPPTPPIAINAPAQGTTYFSTDTIIPQATIANLSSFPTIVYLLDGIPVDPTQPLPFSSLPPGDSTLVVAATDNTGNTIYATSTFQVVNSQRPVVTITSPLDGHSYLQNDVASINATITDASPIATTTYKLNGALVDPTQTLPFMSQPLGSQTLVVSATNTFGNIGYATSTFTLLPPDLTAPVIVISNPTAGATYTDGANVFLTATITDASSIAATSYTFNGATVDPTQPLPLLGAPLGPASVSVAATDAYGNAASSTVNFIIKSSDVTPPAVTITNPVAGHTYLNTASVLAAATITDASGIATSSYILDGIAINPAQPLPLNLAGNGPATLVVTATDNFGNTGSSSVSFIVSAPPPPDTQAPVIVITSPIAGHLYTRNDAVYLTATITDASAIANTRYYLNGQLIDKTKALMLKKAPLGNNTVSVTATDIYGNTGTKTLTFRIVPGDDSCIADITEAYDHKWITDKKTFTNLFNDCQKIHDREHDRDGYDNDDNNHHKDPGSDNRHLQCNSDINDAYKDIDKNIHN